MRSPGYRMLAELLSRGEGGFRLAEAALAVALDEYPALDTAACLARLDAMAAELAQDLPAGASLEARLEALNRLLFERHGFAGNTRDYYDPRNSLLNDVLERRTGIPITLSIVYMDVARGAGLELEGISFPGHFLVACAVPGGKLVLDPYGGGAALGREELEGRLTQLYGAAVLERVDVAELLQPAAPRDILGRMLRNLKAIYLKRRDLPRALAAIERLLLVQPEMTVELRDRGLVYLDMECYRGALDDLERYLGLEPEAADADEIRGRVVDLSRRVARLS
jgi:regulator of sirC expression with transglutaminase-like and TPR domain